MKYVIIILWSLTAGLGLPWDIAREWLPGIGGTAQPASQTVVKPDQTPGDETRKAILDMAGELLNKHYDPQKYRFELSARWIPGNLLKLDPEHISGVELEGKVKRYTNFRVVCRPRGARQSAEIQLGVEMEQKLPVANRRIPSGEVVTKNDLLVKWTRISPGNAPPIRKINRIEGKTLRRTLLADQPVRQSDIGTKYLVSAGDMVTLIFKKRGIRVQLTGKAREHGAKHDEIRIYSDETRKKYVGKVIRPGVAIWKQTL